MKNNITINLSKDTPPETVSALLAILKAQKVKQRKQPLYLSNEDIEKLNDRYEYLYTKVKNAINLSNEQISRECEILLDKYNFELEELSALAEADYMKRKAQIKAKNDEQIPWRRCWLWRLLFQPLTNRAQDIVEEEAALNAEELFTGSEEELKARAVSIYGENVKKLSKRKRKRALKKYLKYKRILEGKKDSALERLIAALDKTDDATQRTTAFEEPQSQPTEPGADKPGELSEDPKTDDKNAGSVSLSITQESTKQPVKGDDVAPMATTEPGKAKQKEQLPGQMSIADVAPMATTEPGKAKQKEQLPGQMSIADVQPTARRARPPRSSRKA